MDRDDIFGEANGTHKLEKIADVFSYMTQSLIMMNDKIEKIEAVTVSAFSYTLNNSNINASAIAANASELVDLKHTGQQHFDCVETALSDIRMELSYLKNELSAVNARLSAIENQKKARPRHLRAAVSKAKESCLRIWLPIGKKLWKKLHDGIFYFSIRRAERQHMYEERMRQAEQAAREELAEIERQRQEQIRQAAEAEQQKQKMLAEMKQRQANNNAIMKILEGIK